MSLEIQIKGASSISWWEAAVATVCTMSAGLVVLLLSGSFPAGAGTSMFVLFMLVFASMQIDKLLSGPEEAPDES